MTEKQKIKKLISKFKPLFEVTDMDVAESIKGEWFFCRYNPENKYYDVLARFETAEELAEIMLGEIASDVLTTIDCVPEEPSYHNFADDLEMESTYQPQIERLIEYLGK